MRRGLPILIVLVVLLGAATAYAKRGALRDAWEARHAEPVPAATAFRPPTPNVVAAEEAGSIEGGVSTSSNYMIVTSTSAPTSIDPLDASRPMPVQANLDVPFTSQAPYGDWAFPYQEACEEASLAMVDAFYGGMTGSIDPVAAKKAIDAVVEYQRKTKGDYLDTTAAETAQIAKGLLGYKDARVLPVRSMDDVRRVVANGFPVILPASGKALNNPNFRNGGPPYHMLVVKGYTATGKIITNDPGTRKGKDYVYDAQVLFNAVHDWNGGKVMEGAKVMLVILPN